MPSSATTWLEHQQQQASAAGTCKYTTTYTRRMCPLTQSTRCAPQPAPNEEATSSLSLCCSAPSLTKRRNPPLRPLDPCRDPMEPRTLVPSQHVAPKYRPGTLPSLFAASLPFHRLALLFVNLPRSCESCCYAGSRRIIIISLIHPEILPLSPEKTLADGLPASIQHRLRAHIRSPRASADADPSFTMSAVKNLRAMFENKGDASPADEDRGRSLGVSSPSPTPGGNSQNALSVC